MLGQLLVWEKSALIEHRHSQSMKAFARLHFRYGQWAFLYQAKRKQRGSGTMTEDAGFHKSILRLLLKHRKDFPGLRVFGVFALMLWWEIVNAFGFLHGMVFKKRTSEPSARRAI